MVDAVTIWLDGRDQERRTFTTSSEPPGTSLFLTSCSCSG
jgi:hypothetical protein